MRADGVEQFLATIITEQIPRMCARLSRLVLWETDNNYVEYTGV